MPADQPFMINFRLTELDARIARRREAARKAVAKVLVAFARGAPNDPAGNRYGSRRRLEAAAWRDGARILMRQPFREPFGLLAGCVPRSSAGQIEE